MTALQPPDCPRWPHRKAERFADEQPRMAVLVPRQPRVAQKHVGASSPRRACAGCQTFGFAHSPASTGRSMCRFPVAAMPDRACCSLKSRAMPAASCRVRTSAGPIRPLRSQSRRRAARPSAIPDSLSMERSMRGPRLHHPGHRQRLRSAPQQTVALSSRPQPGLGGEEERQLPEVAGTLCHWPLGSSIACGPRFPRASPASACAT